MAYEELFTDLLKAEREEDVTDALAVFGLDTFSDSNMGQDGISRLEKRSDGLLSTLRNYVEAVGED